MKKLYIRLVDNVQKKRQINFQKQKKCPLFAPWNKVKL